MITIVTALVEVQELLAEATIGAVQLEGPQEVVALLEVGTHGVDLVHQILHGEDAELAQHLLDLLVAGNRHALHVQLRVTALVDQGADRLQVGVTVGDVGLHDAQHLLRGLVHAHEHGVVDLAQTQQLQGLLHLGRHLVNTADTHHDRDAALALNEVLALVVSLSSLGDQVALHLLVLLLVLLAALHHLLSLRLVGSNNLSSKLLRRSLQLSVTTLLQNNGLGTTRELGTSMEEIHEQRFSDGTDQRHISFRASRLLDGPSSLQRTRPRSIHMEDDIRLRIDSESVCEHTQAFYRKGKEREKEK